MNAPLSNDWLSTDTVHEQQPATAPVQKAAVHVDPVHQVSHVAIEPTHVSMRLAAISGITLVLVSAATLFFGLDYLSLSGSVTTPSAEVRITTDGLFSPAEISLAAGASFTIISDHADPQVLKNREVEDAFDRPVLFEGESADIVVPADLPEGTYHFYSETLPVDVVLAVHVASQVAGETLEDLPIPSLNEVTDNPAPTTPSFPSVTVRQTSQSSSTTATTPATVRVDGSQAPIGEDNPFADSATIPLNPYTIGNRPVTATPPQNLHSGAPIAPHPRSQPETGSGTWLFLILGVAVATGMALIPVRKAIA